VVVAVRWELARSRTPTEEQASLADELNFYRED